VAHGDTSRRTGAQPPESASLSAVTTHRAPASVTTSVRSTPTLTSSGASPHLGQALD